MGTAQNLSFLFIISAKTVLRYSSVKKERAHISANMKFLNCVYMTFTVLSEQFVA